MPRPERPSYEELAARNAELAAVVEEQAALIESPRAEVAALRRQAGRDSSTSSQPPSQDSPAAEARAKARARGWRARPGRSQGGQKGHPGASLAWSASPDETVLIAPGSCGGCGADLAGGAGRVASRVQVLDIPPAALTVTEYQTMACACGCGHVTTTAPPGATGGPVCYGPNVVAAATLLASTDVIGIERAADLMAPYSRGRSRPVRVAVPGPPGRGLDRRRVRGRPQGRAAGGGRARRRRDSRPAHQRGRLREPH
jgi:transposase